MFRAFLGYFQGEVAFVDHFLLDAFHLVSEHKGISGAAFGLERVSFTEFTVCSTATVV